MSNNVREAIRLSVDIINTAKYQRFHADFFSSLTAKKSALFGFTSIVLPSRSLSRFSIIQRATIAIAACSIHCSNSCFTTLDRFADRLSADSSKSCMEVADASKRNSSGGNDTDGPLDNRFDFMTLGELHASTQLCNVTSALQGTF